jgi:hypothetical protein
MRQVHFSSMYTKGRCGCTGRALLNDPVQEDRWIAAEVPPQSASIYLYKAIGAWSQADHDLRRLLQARRVNASGVVSIESPRPRASPLNKRATCYPPPTVHRAATPEGKTLCYMVCPAPLNQSRTLAMAA